MKTRIIAKDLVTGKVLRIKRYRTHHDWVLIDALRGPSVFKRMELAKAAISDFMAGRNPALYYFDIIDEKAAA